MIDNINPGNASRGRDKCIREWGFDLYIHCFGFDLIRLIVEILEYGLLYIFVW